MIVAGQVIEPGEKRRIPIPVGEGLSLETVCFCGRRPGRTLVVTSGVHGCEYVGVETLTHLSEELDPEEMSGSLILLPLANPEGFYEGVKRVVPEDGKNLNRAFPGDKAGSISAQMAYAIETYLYPAADFLADLHGGDCCEALTPLVFFTVAGEKKVNDKALTAARELTVPYRIRSTAKNGLYSWAVQKGIPALLIERGGQGTWSQQEVKQCREDVYSLLRHMEILPGTNPKRQQREICQTVYEEARHSGFWYPFKRPDERTVRGELLGQIKTPSGQILQEVRAEFDGIVLYHTISLGVKQGDSLIAYGKV